MSEDVTETVEESVDDSVIEVDESGAEIVETAAPTKAETKALRELRLKVDGQELIEQLPFDLPAEAEEYVRQQLQLAKVAQRRMQETAEAKKYNAKIESDVKEFLIALREDPESVLSSPELGIDVKNFAEKIMAKQLEEASKSPEVKEREALEKRLKELEGAKARLEADNRMKELKAAEDRIANELETELVSAIESGGLPNDPEVLSMMAKNMKVALKFNIPVSASELIPIVKREIYEKVKKQLSLLKDNELAEFIGKDRFNRIRKDMLKTLKSEIPSAKNIKDSGTAPKKETDGNVFGKKNTGGLKSRDYFKNPLKYIKG